MRNNQGSTERWTCAPQRAVAAFHQAMGLPSIESPTMLSLERGDFRCRLIEEEVGEFREATERGDWLAMVDALVDIVYVTYGTAVELGVDLDPYFEEVHRTNLRKVGAADGGKSIKPPGWTPPDLATIFRQMHGDVPVPVRPAVDER